MSEPLSTNSATALERNGWRIQQVGAVYGPTEREPGVFYVEYPGWQFQQIEPAAVHETFGGGKFNPYIDTGTTGCAWGALEYIATIRFGVGEHGGGWSIEDLRAIAEAQSA